MVALIKENSETDNFKEVDVVLHHPSYDLTQSN
jgi:hypothetical protein